MYRLGESILAVGVLMFMVGGLGVIFNIIPRDSRIISPLAVLALIFVGAGSSVKIYHKQGK